jgi:tRNA (cytidine32/uridine32-2'-O)-methyltransferase
LYKLRIPVKRRARMNKPMNPLDAIRAVLVRPTHPGNIGGAARALKNMGLSRLRLVAPADYHAADANARAADAADVLAHAVACDTLDDAIGDCHFVIGTTARSRRIEWPTVDPYEGAARLVEQARRGPAAVLFGPERSGLTNAELDRCHLVVCIPSNPDYPSLNLVCAVQILAYELYRRTLDGSLAPITTDTPATDVEMNHLYRHLEEVLTQLKFLDPENPRLLQRRLRRLFNRAHPDQNEVNILRGVLTQVQTVLRKLDTRSKE